MWAMLTPIVVLRARRLDTVQASWRACKELGRFRAIGSGKKVPCGSANNCDHSTTCTN